jgi:hypothetical protein
MAPQPSFECNRTESRTQETVIRYAGKLVFRRTVSAREKGARSFSARKRILHVTDESKVAVCLQATYMRWVSATWTVAISTRRAKHPRWCQASPAKIFIFPKDGNYDLKKPARLDMGDVMAIRHQT